MTTVETWPFWVIAPRPLLPEELEAEKTREPDDEQILAASRFARRAYAFDESAHPRDTSGRFSTKEGSDAPDMQPQVEPDVTRNEAWAEQGRAAADNFTGEMLSYEIDLVDMIYGGSDDGDAEAQAAIMAGFQPGTALALSNSVSEYQKAFLNAQDIYEAAQVLQGVQDPDRIASNDSQYAYAREIMNAMANGVPEDKDTYSIYATVGNDYEGPPTSMVMTMGTGDELVRGVGDRGGLVESMQAALESGEPVSWPLASFGWGRNYESYSTGIADMSGDTYTGETADQAALKYASGSATNESLTPVLMSLQGTVEGAFVIDGQYEVLTGGSFRVVDVRQDMIPDGNANPDYADENPDDWQFDQVDETTGELIEDANGDPIPLDVPVYVGSFTPVTRVVLEQVEGPKPV